MPNKNFTLLISQILICVYAISGIAAISAKYFAELNIAENIAIIVSLFYFSILLHECGHAIAILLIGGKITSISVTPFRLDLKSKRLSISYVNKRSDISGGVLYKSPSNISKKQSIFIAASGPLFELMLSLFLLIPINMALSEISHGALYTLLIISVSNSVANLIPTKNSDGYIILMAARKPNSP